MKIEDFKKYINEKIFTEPNYPDIGIYILLNDFENSSCKFLAAENSIKDDIKSELKESVSNLIKSTEKSDQELFLEKEDLIVSKKGLYRIKEETKFSPFSKIIEKLNDNELFDISDADSIKGYLFKISNRENYLYIFSKSYDLSMYNIKKNVIYAENNTLFRKFSKKLLKIETHIDMIFYENNIITEKIKTLEKDFKYESHEKTIAYDMMNNWKKNNYIVFDDAKLNEWMTKHPSYIKKIMAIKSSVIFEKSKQELLSLIQKDDYYKKNINIKAGKIEIKSENKFKSFLTMMNDERVYSSFSSTTYFSEVKQKE